MNKQAKQLWIEALRSGEYKQGNGALNYKDKYCCLGVLCEVYLKNCPNPEIHKTTSSCGSVRYNNSYTYLPAKVFEWADLNNEVVFVTLNDRCNLSFSEIADYIEENC